MNTVRLIISWVPFSGVMLMLAFFLYSCARVRMAMAGYWHAKAQTEKKRTNIVVDGN